MIQITPAARQRGYNRDITNKTEVTIMFYGTLTELTSIREILDVWGQNRAVYHYSDDGCITKLDSIEEILEYFFDEETIVTE